MRNQYRGACAVCQFKGGLARKRWYFLSGGGVDTPMHTIRVVQNLKGNLFFVSKVTRIWWILIWALKSLKNLHFDCSLLCTVYNVWLKKVQRSIFHDTEESWKIWRKTDLWFRNWHEEFCKFSSEHLEMSKLVFSWDTFVPSRKCMSYKLNEKSEDELTCRFKIDIRNSVNFDLSTQKSQNLHFNGLLLTKLYNFWAKKVQRSYV